MEEKINSKVNKKVKELDEECKFLANFTNSNNLKISLTIDGNRIMANLDNSDITEEEYNDSPG